MFKTCTTTASAAVHPLYASLQTWSRDQKRSWIHDRRLFAACSWAFAVTTISLSLGVTKVGWNTYWTRDAEVRAQLVTLSRAAVIADFATLQRDLEASVPDDPEVYFHILKRKDAVALQAQHYLRKVGRDRDVEALINRVHGAIAHLQDRYQQRHTRDVMAATSVAYFKRHPEERYEASRTDTPEPPPSTDWSAFWDSGAHAYAWIMILAVPFFFVRLKSQRLLLAIESWRVPLAAMAWPVAVWIYPTIVDPRKQIERCRQFVAYAFSALMSIVGMTGTTAAQQGAKAGTSRNAPTAEVMSLPELTHLAVDIFPWTAGTGTTEIAPEYGWRWKTPLVTINGFGFYELRGKGAPWFTNHAFSIIPNDPRFSWLGYSQEQGAGPQGHFLQCGGRVVLTKAPWIDGLLSPVFSFLQVSRYAKVNGVRVPNETLVAWSSQALRLRGWKAWTEGFYRFRSARSKDFGQPQVWVGHDQVSWISVGTEVELAGGVPTYLVGIRLTLR